MYKTYATHTHTHTTHTASSSDGSNPASNESITEEEQGSGSTSESQERTPRNLSPKLPDIRSDHHSRSNSVGGESTPEVNGFHSLPGVSHRRQTSLGVLATGGSSSPLRQHRRQQSLVSGQSSKSTSAYSTLSERSTGSWEDETGSISGSTFSRLSLLPPSARVEQSRVNAQSVIEQLFKNHDFLAREEGEEEGGLKIYVDKSAGTATVTGHDL